MRSEQTVLIVTQPSDVTADYVVAELDRRSVPVFRCNPGDFPGSLTLTSVLDAGWTGSLRATSGDVQLGVIGCAWYRRPSVFEFAVELNSEERAWALAEARRGFGGILAAVPRCVCPCSLRVAMPLRSASAPAGAPPQGYWQCQASMQHRLFWTISTPALRWLPAVAMVAKQFRVWPSAEVRGGQCLDVGVQAGQGIYRLIASFQAEVRVTPGGPPVWTHPYLGSPGPCEGQAAFGCRGRFAGR